MTWQDKIRDPNCELCPLHESADYVCLMGAGPKKAKVMIVGEAPGEREDESHVAFVGPSGRLLRMALREVGIEPEECYITNVSKCRPPENRTPTKTEARICANEYLSVELERVDPDFVLAVGNAPLLALCGLTGITKHRGTLVDMGDYKVFPTFHPAYVLRSPQFEPTFKSDLERFAGLVSGKGTKITPTRTRIIRSKDGLRWLRDELASKPLVAFDFETNDRGAKVHKDFRYYNPWEPGAAIVCASFSWEEGQSVVVPLWHDESPWRENWQRVFQFLKDSLERDVKLVAHNGKFDCKWAWQFGCNWKMTFDTLLAAHLLEENRLKGLKPLSQLLLGADAYDIELVDTHTIPLKKLARYAGKDTDYTLRLYHILKVELKKEPRLARIFARLMMRASHVLTEVELGGTWVDPARLQRQMRTTSRAKKLAHRDFLGYVENKDSYNEKMLNSPKQLAHFFFTDLGLDPLKETKTGANSTDEEVMLQLGHMHPAAAKLLEYRKHKGNLEKLTSWDKRRDKNSRIHTNYKLYGTVTGRLSSEKPNLQQVPREGPMRACFGAPEGWKFVEADYSQIELRIAAMVAQEDTMIRVLNAGEDMHYNTASEILRKPPSEITKDERVVWGKHPNFGLLFSMGPKGYVDYCRQNGIEVTLAQAKEVYSTFHHLYPRLRIWHDRQVRLAQRYGRVHSPIGRVRHLPTVRSSEDWIRAEAERQAINSPVQSLASDFMLLSLVLLAQRLPRTRARPVGTVHDSLLFEMRDDYVEEGVKLVREVMEDMSEIEKFGAIITVPIVVEVEVGQYWGEGVVV